MKRRTFMAGAPAFAILPASVVLANPTDTAVAALVEAVMASIVPNRCAGFSTVTASDLRALCEATGVRWREHWAEKAE